MCSQTTRGQRVVAAAIRDDTGTVHSLPPPARHSDVLKSMYDKGLHGLFTDNMGFLLEDGTFVDRAEAGRAALASGQVTELAHDPPKLFSDDLW